MAEATHFAIGAEATCIDGVCGDVSRVVIDPVGRTVTHLVVEPKHRRGLGRLVPLDLVEDTTGAIRLLCTQAQFEKLAHAEETRFLPGSNGFLDNGPERSLSLPYYGLINGSGFGAGSVTQAVTYDTVPLGEVTMRRGQHVHATDGAIGQVQGVVINSDRHVTHVLLEEGHLWGRKQVAIPIRAVTEVNEGVQLSITRQDVKALPAIGVTADVPRDDS